MIELTNMIDRITGTAILKVVESNASPLRAKYHEESKPNLNRKIDPILGFRVRFSGLQILV